MSERKWIAQIESATGMQYCDEDCGCGDSEELLFWPVGGEVPEWLPGWTNGTSPMEVFRWMREEAQTNPAVLAAATEAGLSLEADGAV